MSRRICLTRKSANWPLPGTITSQELEETVRPARLVKLINTLNAEGVRKYSRLPPEELISKMETASRESAEYHQALDPFSRCRVSW